MPPLSKMVRVTVVSAVFLAAMTACTTVFETGNLNETEGVACRSSAGAYYMPRVLVRIALKRATEPGRGFQLDKETPKFPTVADRRHQPYCLDYLASPTSKDVIAVERGTNGLLQKVYSNVKDRSTQIALTLIQTGALFAKAGLRSGVLGAGPQETVDFTFDPFDPQELSEINRAMRRFGFCAYIENHSFEDGAINPQAWCSDPNQERYVNQYNMMLATTPIRPEAMSTGILYRPNATHKLVIRRKSDPTGREPWALFMTKHMEWPNVSPIFSIGVYRALFTTRLTELKFENGVLTNVSIDKGSELESFSQIPLAVATAIVQLPTEIIQLRINDTKDQTSLASAEMALITTLADLNKTTMNNPGAVATMGLPVGQIPDRLKQLFEHCVQLGGTSEFCKAKIMGTPQ